MTQNDYIAEDVRNHENLETDSDDDFILKREQHYSVMFEILEFFVSTNSTG